MEGGGLSSRWKPLAGNYIVVGGEGVQPKAVGFGIGSRGFGGRWLAADGSRLVDQVP